MYQETAPASGRRRSAQRCREARRSSRARAETPTKNIQDGLDGARNLVIRQFREHWQAEYLFGNALGHGSRPVDKPCTTAVRRMQVDGDWIMHVRPNALASQ